LLNKSGPVTDTDPIDAETQLVAGTGHLTRPLQRALPVKGVLEIAGVRGREDFVKQRLLASEISLFLLFRWLDHEAEPVRKPDGEDRHQREHDGEGDQRGRHPQSWAGEDVEEADRDLWRLQEEQSNCQREVEAAGGDEDSLETGGVGDEIWNGEDSE